MPVTETDEVKELLTQFGKCRSSLIAVLQEVQRTHRYLPQPTLRRISQQLEIPLPEIYHVATFYNCFSLEPVGRHVVQVCMGTACHVRGAPKVLDRLLTDLKLPKLGTTPDAQFTLRTVRCVGCCGLAPVVRVDDHTHPNMSQPKVKGMIRKYAARPETANAVPAHK